MGDEADDNALDGPTPSDKKAAAGSGSGGGDWGKSDYAQERLNTIGSDIPISGSSPWAKHYTTRDALQRNLYTDESGPVSLNERLLQFRTTAAGQDEGNLQLVQDWYVGYSKHGGTLGDDMPRGTTVAELMDRMRRGTPAEVKAMQDKLAKAGFYDDKVYSGKIKVRTGKYDQATQQALTRALTAHIMEAPSQDYQFDEFLKDQAAQVEAEGGLKARVNSAREALVINVANPADIASNYRSVAQELTGRAHPAEAAAAVPAYQGIQAGAQQQEYDLSGATGAGGTVVNPPSAANFAEEQLRTEHGAEVGAHAVLMTYNMLLNRLGLAG